MIEEIRATLARVFSSSKGPWSLLDFPTHSNVGDSAIWLGAVELLTPIFGLPPRHVATVHDFPTGLDAICPDGPILLNGGGNFGDLWGGYHEYRLRLLQEYRHRRIIQLPQSLYFSSRDAVEEMREAIDAHPDFTLLVRDRASLDFAQRWFDCSIYLCPDLAFGLESLPAEDAPTSEIFFLLRHDRETLPGRARAVELEELGPVADWVDERWRLPRSERLRMKVARKLPVLARYLAPDLQNVFRSKAEQEVRRGVDMLGQGKIVVTDRLHGHILCVLMQKPHIVIDNSYGKLSSFIDTWPDDGLTFRASDMSQIRHIAEQILA